MLVKMENDVNSLESNLKLLYTYSQASKLSIPSTDICHEYI